jgi:signal transduction histidine kinase
MGIFAYNTQMSQLHESLKDLAKNQKKLFQNILSVDAEGLALTNAGLTRLETLVRPFSEERKSELLAAATPLFKELKQINNITHMYFIEPDGTVFLRAHRPEQFGDKLTRVTFKRAVATRKTASGLEMGLNFFSLRCVTPISYRGKIIGYMEVAEEIDHVFSEMKAINATEVSLFLATDYLEKYQIDFGTERVADFAILYPTDKKMTLQLAEKCKEIMPEALNQYMVSIIHLGNAKYVVGMGPIEDAFGSTAGILFSYKDVTPHFSAMWEGIVSSLLTFIAIFFVSSVLFYFSLRKSLVLFTTLKQDIQAVTKTSDLSKRLEVSTHDEVGELAENFNLMKEEIAKLHEKLALRAEELSAANQELEKFNYMVSHDLRKPLTIINGYCQAILARGGTLEEELKEYVNEIYNGTLRMNQLIDALLRFSASARSELHREPVDLSRIAETVAAELRLTEPERVARFEIADGITCNGDKTLLRLVMENLLGNAWKYSSNQKETIIEFGVKNVAGERAYFVRDNGVGFDTTHSEKLFVPFQRLPEANAFKGHGIGLATVARIVQRHGGKVWAEGEPGKGAIFYFTLNP